MTSAKKARPRAVPNRINIYHDVSSIQRHENHKINKAIKRINQIVKLIFKNTKDSTAITTGSGGSVLVPERRNASEDIRFQELSRIVKQINIVIPKKFESKTQLREFFYSRDFILSLKIKMQESFHNAILQSNNLPRGFVDPNQAV